jgi:beta-glucosidase
LIARRSLLAGSAAALLAAAISSRAVAADQRPAFHWGVASAGFQCEGSTPDSNWRRYVAARGPGITDPYLNSVDFRHRYAADVALARAMGVNTYRFSVEWARIEPRRGVPDQAELAYYDDLVHTVLAAGMTPMITLDHWVYPGWVADQGAWDTERTMTDWLANARTVVSRYAGLGVQWITFNEPTVYLEKELQYRPMNLVQVLLMRQHLVATHRAAYDLIHQLDPGAMVTSNVAYLAPPLQAPSDAAFFDQVTDKLDFIGIDYYYGLSLDNTTLLYAATGDLWNIDPQPDGLLYALRSYHQKVPRLPVYVVENGMCTDNGAPRADGYTRSDHLRDHIYYLQRAKADGINVIGYNYWSGTDNYEWGSYSPRFGLYTVDALTDPTLTRRPTDAVSTYQQVIANAGVPAGYTPVKPPAFCAPADVIDTCLGPIASLR